MVHNYIIIYVRNWWRTLGKRNEQIVAELTIHLPDKEIKNRYKTVQIEIRLSEYGGNKKAVQTDGLLANYQNLENAKTIFFHHHTP